MAKAPRKSRKTQPAKSTKAKTAVQRKPVQSKPKPFPGLWAYSKEIDKTLLGARGLFGRLLLLGWIVLVLVLGLSFQSEYAGLSQSTEEVTGQLAGGVLKTSVEVGALFLSMITGSLATNITASQQLYTGIVYLLLWLTMVWLLRHVMLGNPVRVRDGVYNSGSPIVSTLLVVSFAFVQLLPLGIVATLFAALVNNGILQGALWTTFGVVAILAMTAVSVYWLLSTLFAAVVVTIPGTYPWAAIKSARTLIVGYRKLVFTRVLWLAFLNILALLVVMVPVILLDALVGYKLSAFVVAIYQLVSVALFMYSSAYLYILYRKVIDARA